MTAPYSRVLEAPEPALSGTALTLHPDDGPKFPAPPFVAIIWPEQTVPTPTNSEELRVNEVTGDVFTVHRSESPIAIEANMMVGVLYTVPRVKLGETIRLEIFYTDDEAPYTLRVQSPQGAVSTVTSTAGTDSDGHTVYFAEIEGDESGLWTYRWEVGPDKAATPDGAFFAEFTGTQ